MSFPKEFINSDILKVHVLLSARAQVVMSEDMMDFENHKKANFINHVFMNFKQEANASISIRLQEEEDKLRTLFAEIRKENENYDEVIKKLVDIKKYELMTKVKSYEKDVSLPIRIQKRVYEYLVGTNCHEEEYYNNMGGKYIRAVIEEYAELPFYERELIYFKGQIEKINSFINEKKIIRITLMSGKEFHILPIKVMPDTMKNHNYVAGYKINTSTGEKHFSSYRLCRVSNVDESSLKYEKIIRKEYEKLTYEEYKKLTYEEYKKLTYENDVGVLNDKIKEKGVQFLCYDVQDVVVRLTEKGEKKFKMIQHLRPHVEKIDGDKYFFRCTAEQAEYYFLRLDKDACVADPPKLRNKMKKIYKKALETYNTNE